MMMVVLIFFLDKVFLIVEANETFPKGRFRERCVIMLAELSCSIFYIKYIAYVS